MIPVSHMTTAQRVTDMLDYFGYTDPITGERFADLVSDADAYPRAHIVEAVCDRCGETFNPNDPFDLIHALRSDEEECGGLGRLAGFYANFVRCANADHDHGERDEEPRPMVCAHCKRPLHYDYRPDRDTYFHDDGDACWLHAASNDDCVPDA